MSILSKLQPPAGSKRKANRVGRGIGSGNGKTCGRGQKGQGARSGSGGRRHFEGGQLPLQRRLPKRGFHNIHRTIVVNLNVGQLAVFEKGTEVTPELLRERGMVKGKFDAIKILGDGELSTGLTIVAHRFSASAKEKIEKAGGKATVLAYGKSTDAPAEQADAS